MYRKKTGRKISAILCLVFLFTLTAGILPFAKADAAAAFSDVSPDSYYYTEVTSMAGQGIVNGIGDGTFLPQNPVSNAEAAKLVCGMAGVSYAGYTGQTSPWYTDVWQWALDNGIVPAGTQPTAYATREQICSYITAAYKLNTSATSTNAFTDTNSKVANTLYDYGVIKGIDNGDGTFSFGGSENVKRCDTCIMLYRLSQKVAKPSWPAVTPVSPSPAPSQGYTLDKSHYVVSKPASLTSYSDYIQAWSYMLVNKQFTLDFTLPSNYTEQQLRNIMTNVQGAYYYSSFDYMEYAAFLNGWSVSVPSGTQRGDRIYNPTLRLQIANANEAGKSLSESQVKSEISAFETTCDDIVTQLFQSGELKESMSVKQRAYVLYRYVVLHTKYDTSSRYYNGYDAAVRKTAVCQGYTSMYNYLCNIAGVPMEAMTGTSENVGHAWSRIYSGGTYYNVDTTWGDPVPDQPGYCDDSWFWVTDNYLKYQASPTRTFAIDSMQKAA